MPMELVLLGWSVVLLFVHFGLQSTLATRERGPEWNMSARDGQSAALGVHAARAQRALDNFKETYPAFVALALAVVVADRTGAVSAWGAGIWFAARIAYLPLYLLGVPVWRTAVFGVSAFGLILMLVALLTGAGSAP